MTPLDANAATLSQPDLGSPAKLGSPVKIGIIGCGQISGIYIETAQRMRNLSLAAIADVYRPAAEARAAQYGLDRVCSVEELLADPEIQIVINLTVPAAHAEVASRIIESGKSVYNEKPLATSLADARRLLELARARGQRVGCAPDTFLGASLQTCRKLIDDGQIGEPVAATAFMIGHGPETVYPPREEEPSRRRVTQRDPSFYFKAGVGPMFDMGPYYLTALATLIGPFRRASGSARITWPERPLGNPRYSVETPTFIAGVLDHESGAVSTVITTTDVWPTGLPFIEIYGSEGSLSLPDPNNFSGKIRLRRANENEWTDVAPTHGYGMNSRGLGVADMAQAIVSGRSHRVSGDLAYHVLEAMQGIHDASASGRYVEIMSHFERPAPLPVGLADGEIDR